MKAVVVNSLRCPPDLAFEEWPGKEVTDDEVRIQVHASSLGFVDRLIMEGNYQIAHSPPFVPGGEAAGIISAVGTDVKDLKVGDRVIGLSLEMGCLAEEVVMPARLVHPLPDQVSFLDAAVMLGNYGTVDYAFRRAGLSPGETVVIHGAAGGVGLAAVEMAGKLGATVIATAGSDERLAVAKEHGADHLVNYREASFATRVKEITGGRGADVILDPVNGEVFKQSLKCIAPEGRIVVLGFAGGEFASVATNILLVKEVTVIGAVWGGRITRKPEVLRDELGVILRDLAKGLYRPHIHAIYDFVDASAALEEIADRKVIGKIAMVSPLGRIALGKDA